MSVRVYKVKLYNVATDEMVISRRMATVAGARMMGGDIVDGTEVEIDESKLESGMQWTARVVSTHTRRQAFSEGLNPDPGPVRHLRRDDPKAASPCLRVNNSPGSDVSRW